MWLLTAATFTGASSIHYQTPMLASTALAHSGWLAVCAISAAAAAGALAVQLIATRRRGA
jgi:hypothetical protein